MTKGEKTIKDIERFLNQHCDGFALVAFHPVSGEPMIAASGADIKTKIALNTLLSSVIGQGGVAAYCARKEDDDEPGEESGIAQPGSG